MKVIDYRNNSRNQLPKVSSKPTLLLDASFSLNDFTESVDLLESSTSPFEESITSEAAWSQESGLMEDIDHIIKAMLKMTMDKATRYKKKAKKALAEAIACYTKDKQDSSKALVSMRQYSYYKVKARHMKGANSQLKALMEDLDQLQEQQQNSNNKNNNPYNAEVSEKLRRLQGMLKKTPLSADTDLKLLEELETIVAQRQQEVDQAKSNPDKPDMLPSVPVLGLAA